MSTIKLANHIQVTLMKCELQGQLSDGFWENSRPYDHWELPARAEVIVAAAPEEIGIDFYPKRNYNFASPTLLEYVGDRMLHFARLSRRFPTLSPAAIRATNSGEWYWLEPLLGKTWNAEQLAELATVGINSYTDVQTITKELEADQTYTMKSLRKDLKMINIAFKVVHK